MSDLLADGFGLGVAVARGGHLAGKVGVCPGHRDGLVEFDPLGYIGLGCSVPYSAAQKYL